jgi:hypothetical protein
MKGAEELVEGEVPLRYLGEGLMEVADSRRAFSSASRFWMSFGYFESQQRE